MSLEAVSLTPYRRRTVSVAPNEARGVANVALGAASTRKAPLSLAAMASQPLRRPPTIPRPSVVPPSSQDPIRQTTGDYASYTSPTLGGPGSKPNQPFANPPSVYFPAAPDSSYRGWLRSVFWWKRMSILVWTLLPVFGVLFIAHSLLSSATIPCPNPLQSATRSSSSSASISSEFSFSSWLSRGAALVLSLPIGIFMLLIHNPLAPPSATRHVARLSTGLRVHPIRSLFKYNLPTALFVVLLVPIACLSVSHFLASPSTPPHLCYAHPSQDPSVASSSSSSLTLDPVAYSPASLYLVDGQLSANLPTQETRHAIHLGDWAERVAALMTGFMLALASYSSSLRRPIEILPSLAKTRLARILSRFPSAFTKAFRLATRVTTLVAAILFIIIVYSHTIAPHKPKPIDIDDDVDHDEVIDTAAAYFDAIDKPSLFILLSVTLWIILRVFLISMTLHLLGSIHRLVSITILTEPLVFGKYLLYGLCDRTAPRVRLLAFRSLLSQIEVDPTIRLAIFAQGNPALQATASGVSTHLFAVDAFPRSHEVPASHPSTGTLPPSDPIPSVWNIVHAAIVKQIVDTNVERLYNRILREKKEDVQRGAALKRPGLFRLIAKLLQSGSSNPSSSSLLSSSSSSSASSSTTSLSALSSAPTPSLNDSHTSHLDDDPSSISLSSYGAINKTDGVDRFERATEGLWGAVRAFLLGDDGIGPANDEDYCNDDIEVGSIVFIFFISY